MYQTQKIVSNSHIITETWIKGDSLYQLRIATRLRDQEQVHVKQKNSMQVHVVKRSSNIRTHTETNTQVLCSIEDID